MACRPLEMRLFHILFGSMALWFELRWSVCDSRYIAWMNEDDKGEMNNHKIEIPIEVRHSVSVENPISELPNALFSVSGENHADVT